ncbi:tyrosine-type recombinase/integrase [Massilia sp. Mn16-1_5]|uniref:tyrosine-type recombinase/integrase n=1 Tax=Massilia sp. Mn16-1_5 TaxID=2079199 RepID=UPI00109E7D2E|nr:tyrosine-type recombinase/integrase [Massilia sp. Mn16-1_5]THC45875.1 hypothetical protein C2862_05200 [Massilia sp. Mn16-1_5]
MGRTTALVSDSASPAVIYIFMHFFAPLIKRRIDKVSKVLFLMELYFFDPKIFDNLPNSERKKYTELINSLAIPAGRPFFLDKNHVPDKELDGFCSYLLEPRRRSPNTWRTYANQISLFLRFVEAQKKTWKDVTRKDLLTYYRVRTTGDFQDGNIIKGQSWNVTASAVVHLYEYGVEAGIVEVLPYKYRKSRAMFGRGHTETSELIVNTIPERVNFISITNYKTLWRPALAQQRNAQRNLALSDLLITVGLRISEALSLQTHQLPDPDNIKFAGKKSVSIRVVGKGSKPRTVLVPKRIMRALRFYIDEDRQTALKALSRKKKKYKPTNHVFLSEKGTRLSARDVQRFFAGISKRTGLRLSPHGCRHTFAVYQLEAMIKRMALNLRELKQHGADAYRQVLNDPLRQLQLLLGHSMLSSTYIYLDFLEESETLVDESLNDWSDWERQHG